MKKFGSFIFLLYFCRTKDKKNVYYAGLYKIKDG